MRINAAYKEGLKRILETGDLSRVSHEARMYSYGKYGVADAIKEFLSRAEETQEHDEVPGADER